MPKNKQYVPGWHPIHGFIENRKRETYPVGFVKNPDFEDASHMIWVDYNSFEKLSLYYAKNNIYFPACLLSVDSLKMFLLPIDLNKHLFTIDPKEADPELKKQDEEAAKQARKESEENRNPAEPKPPVAKIPDKSKETVKSILYRQDAVNYANFNTLAYHIQPVYIETPILFLFLTGLPTDKYTLTTDVVDLYLLVIHLIESQALPLKFTTKEMQAYQTIFDKEMEHGSHILARELCTRGCFQHIFKPGEVENPKAIQLLVDLLVQHTLRFIQTCERYLWRLLDDRYIDKYHKEFCWHGKLKKWSNPMTERDQVYQKKLVQKLEDLWRDNELTFGVNPALTLDNPVRPGNLPPRQTIDSARGENFRLEQGYSKTYAKICLWWAYSGMWLQQAKTEADTIAKALGETQAAAVVPIPTPDPSPDPPLN